MPSAGADEAFSNPVAPSGDINMDDSKPMKLTNADFRKLLMTPRAPASTGQKDSSSVPLTTQMTPGLAETPTPGQDEKEDAKSLERRKKKSYYARIKKEEDEKMAELAEKYRDRAKERRTGKNPDYQGEDGPQPGAQGAYRAVAPDLKSGYDAAERRRQLIQESKFLGGDMEHTHLVKGLDYALLQKVRSEIILKEQESEVAEISGATEQQQQEKKPQLVAAEEEEINFKTNAGKRIYNGIFNSQPPDFNDIFLPGRLAYTIDLDGEADSDIPITIVRSKSDLVDIESTQATFTSNDIVIQKLSQILSYLRTGKASKKQKKKDKTNKEGTVKGPADDSIYGDIGDYVPNTSSSIKSGKERNRDKEDRDGDRYERGGRKKKSYFSQNPQEEEILAGPKQSHEKRSTQWHSDLPSGTARESEKQQQMLAPSGVLLDNSSKLMKNMQTKVAPAEDFYTECYPDMAEMQDAIDDSDDEADYTKMDLGNKKGPVGRWDFDTQEEYSSYMNQREAMPKAAFQYGVKMADGRKTRRLPIHKEKDRNAELNREWQQIQKILKRKKDEFGTTAGDKRTRYEY